MIHNNNILRDDFIFIGGDGMKKEKNAKEKERMKEGKTNNK